MKLSKVGMFNVDCKVRSKCWSYILFQVKYPVISRVTLEVREPLFSSVYNHLKHNIKLEASETIYGP